MDDLQFPTPGRRPRLERASDREWPIRFRPTTAATGGSPIQTPSPSSSLLAADAQSLGGSQIAGGVHAPDVGQVSPALTDQAQQTAPRRLVVFVHAQMIGQLFDAPGEDGDLDFGGTRVGPVPMELVDGLGFHFLR